MDQDIVESPNVTTVGETGCSVTAGPSGATTENNGVVNCDVEDAVAGRDADNDSASGDDNDDSEHQHKDNVKIKKNEEDNCLNEDGDGAEIDDEAIEGDDVDDDVFYADNAGATAGPSNVGYGAAWYALCQQRA